jgi:hypothetical protein
VTSFEVGWLLIGGGCLTSGLVAVLFLIVVTRR